MSIIDTIRQVFAMFSIAGGKPVDVADPPTSNNGPVANPGGNSNGAPISMPITGPAGPIYGGGSGAAIPPTVFNPGGNASGAPISMPINGPAQDAAASGGTMYPGGNMSGRPISVPIGPAQGGQRMYPGGNVSGTLPAPRTGGGSPMGVAPSETMPWLRRASGRYSAAGHAAADQAVATQDLLKAHSPKTDGSGSNNGNVTPETNMLLHTVANSIAGS